MSTSDGRSSAELQADEDITASHDTGIDHAPQQGEMFTCNSCHEEVDTVIRCDICDNLYDCRCAGMRYDTFMILLSIVNDCGWVCSDCRRIQKTVVNRLATSLAKTNETVADMKCTVDKLKEDIDCMKGETLQLPETTSVEVRKAVSEISRRKHNVIISGLPEITDEVDDDCDIKQLEESMFFSFCEENLTVKPTLSHLGCRRIGKKDSTSNKPRRLLVHLTSEQNAQDLLSSAKAVLRHHPDNHIATQVYFNPDLTRTEARLAFERRQKKRAARQNKQATGISAGSAKVYTEVPKTDSRNEETCVKQSLGHSDNLVADPLLLSGNKEGSVKSVDSIVIEKLETSSMFHEQVAVTMNEGLKVTNASQLDRPVRPVTRQFFRKT